MYELTSPNGNTEFKITPITIESALIETSVVGKSLITAKECIKIATALLNTAALIDSTLPGQDDIHDYKDLNNAIAVLQHINER